MEHLVSFTLLVLAIPIWIATKGIRGEIALLLLALLASFYTAHHTNKEKHGGQLYQERTVRDLHQGG